jgi:methylenetetrahydrofolate dehydrogenase (NADP+)/methenyltetrahydrofolate cyclohydrolase
MSAKILDGKAVSAGVRSEVAAATARLAQRGVVPGLAVVLVGEDPASQIYVRNKTRAAAEVGVRTFDHRLPAETRQDELLALVTRLNDDPEVDGILVQLPLPRHIDATAVLDAIRPDKDVDGFHPDNIGRLAQGRPRYVACTPRGCMILLERAGATLTGCHAVVVGRSNIVGRPMSLLLSNANATVTLCHSKTRDLPAEVQRADVLVAAVGQAELIRGDWLKPGVVVIDVGMNRNAEGKLCGDVHFPSAVERAGAITPVPGGVGPMTIACLLENTVQSAQRCAR